MAQIKFYAVNDQRRTAPKQGWSLRVARSTTIDSKELAMHVERDSQIDHARVEYIMSSVVKQVKEMLFNGHRVELGELGTLSLTCHAAGSDEERQVTVKNNVRGLQVRYRPSALLKARMAATRKELIVLNPDIYGHERDAHGAIVLK